MNPEHSRKMRTVPCFCLLRIHEEQIRAYDMNKWNRIRARCGLTEKVIKNTRNKDAIDMEKLFDKFSPLEIMICFTLKKKLLLCIKICAYYPQMHNERRDE